MRTQKSTYSLFFYINKTRKDKNGNSPIYLRISVNGTKIATSIKRSINPASWDKKGFPFGKSPEVKEISNYMDAIRVKVNKIQTEFLLNETCITAEMFRAALFGARADTEATWCELMQKRIEEEKTYYLRKEKSVHAYNLCRRTLYFMECFLKENYRLSDIPARKVDRQMIDRFIQYLSSQSIGHNYIVLCLQKVKSIFEKALQYNIITSNPMVGIPLSLKLNGKRNHLTEDELNVLLSATFPEKRMENERDVFLFSVFTGLACCDAKNLTREHLVKIDGKWWIRTWRQKTDIIANIPLLPQAEELLKKFCGEDFEHLPYHTKLIPVQCTYTRNKWLKKIEEHCKLNKHLTTHVARHTFATTITLANDVPIETVSHMLGHKSLAMTQHYAKIVNKKVGRDMNNLMDRIGQSYQATVC